MVSLLAYISPCGHCDCMTVTIASYIDLHSGKLLETASKEIVQEKVLHSPNLLVLCLAAIRKCLFELYNFDFQQ